MEYEYSEHRLMRPCKGVHEKRERENKEQICSKTSRTKNSFLGPQEILPIAQGNKYIGIFYGNFLNQY